MLKMLDKYQNKIRAFDLKTKYCTSTYVSVIKLILLIVSNR